MGDKIGFRISVVIPTYNRTTSLMTSLNELDNQVFEDDFEVIVVDDGSTDSTLKDLKKIKIKNFNLKIISQKNAKQGAARNAGVEASSGNLIIFLQDDIWACKDYLSQHYSFHKNHPDENIVAIGLTKWTEDLAKDKLHMFLDGSGGSMFPGPLFDYNSLKNLSETDFLHFYTNNLSIKKSFFQKEKFDESFSSYGWEDIEIGFRFYKRRMKIYFLENALAFHNHKYSLLSFLSRERCVVKNKNMLFRLQPELKTYLEMSFIKRLIFLIFSLKPLLYLYKIVNINLFYYFTGKKIIFDYTND